MHNETINLVALAALLHDIGKFGQRADTYTLRESQYRISDYKYTHAAYTAQILEELGFNLGSEMSDASAMHHRPQNDLHWIIAAADRMASGFERERFEAYNSADSESFKQQRLWHLFDEKRQFRITSLAPEAIFAEEQKALSNEYDALWKAFVDDFAQIKECGNSSSDAFTIDYLLRKFTSLIPSSTSFEKGGYKAVKANIPLYEHAKAAALFASALYALHVKGNDTIVRYYKNEPCDIERQELLIISGDFFGIQHFIFDSVPTAKASKILRAKSAYVQLLIRIISLEIVERLGLSYQSIISTHAGKFEILAINDDATIETLKTIQQELDAFFIKHYFGETGIGISHTPCALADFIVEGRYKDTLRPRIAEAVEAAKFRKFDLLHVSPIVDYDDDLNNQNLCPLCSKRKIDPDAKEDEEACTICDTFVRIGRELARAEYLTLSQKSGQIKIFGSWYINFSSKVHRSDNAIAIFDLTNKSFRGYAKWELSSFVAHNEQGEILTFEELAEQSCRNSTTGIKAIMSLKGDVDNMGHYIKESDITRSFARYNFFARMLDYFFSVYAPTLMQGRALYTVFAGGDDLFVLGAWDEVIEFAKELREKFMEFASGSTLTLSVGMVLVKPNKPINFVARMSEEALEASKHLEGKDAITLFEESVKWEDYLDDFGLSDALKALSDEKLTMALLYRLLEFARMSKSVKTGTMEERMEAAMWKSKLAYAHQRNLGEGHEKLLSTLYTMLDRYPKETKMVICELIYARRDQS